MGALSVTIDAWLDTSRKSGSHCDLYIVSLLLLLVLLLLLEKGRSIKSSGERMQEKATKTSQRKSGGTVVMNGRRTKSPSE